jgi:hypothetical protein
MTARRKTATTKGDAKLLALFARLTRADAQWSAANHARDDCAFKKAGKAWNAIMRSITSTRASGPTGIIAKMRLLAEDVRDETTTGHS